MAINRYFAGLAPSRLRDVEFFQPNIALLQQTLEKKQAAYDEFDFMSRVTPPFRDADTEAVKAWQDKMNTLRDQVTEAYAKGNIAHGDRIMRASLMEVQKGFQPGGLPYSISERKRMEEEFHKSVDTSKLPFDQKQIYKKRMAGQVSPLDLSSDIFTPGFETPTVPDAIDVPTYFMNYASKVIANLKKNKVIKWKEGFGYVYDDENERKVTEEEITDAMLDLAASDRHLGAYSDFIIENDAYNSGITDPNELETYVSDRKLLRDPNNKGLNELHPFVDAIKGAAKAFSFIEEEDAETAISTKSTDATKTNPNNGQTHTGSGGHAWISKVQPAVPRSDTSIMPTANFNDDGTPIIDIDTSTGEPDIDNKNADVFLKNNIDLLTEYSKSSNLFKLFENNDLYGSGALRLKPILDQTQIELFDPLMSFDIEGTDKIPTLTERMNFGSYIPGGSDEDMKIRDVLLGLQWENPDGTLASKEDIEMNVDLLIDAADIHIRRINELLGSIRYINDDSREKFAKTKGNTNRQLFLGDDDTTYDIDWYKRNNIEINYGLIDDYEKKIKKLYPANTRKKYTPVEKHLSAGSALNYIGNRQQETKKLNTLRERVLERVNKLRKENPDKKLTFDDISKSVITIDSPYATPEEKEIQYISPSEIQFVMDMTGMDITTVEDYNESSINNIFDTGVDNQTKRVEEMEKGFKRADIDAFLNDYATLNRDILKKEYSNNKAEYSKDAISDLFSTGHDILYVYTSLGTQGIKPTEGWTKNATPMQQKEAVMRQDVESTGVKDHKDLDSFYVKIANPAELKSGKYIPNIGNITDDKRGKGMWTAYQPNDIVRGIKHKGVVVDGNGQVWAWGNLQYVHGTGDNAILKNNGPMVFYHGGEDDAKNLTQMFYGELGFDGNHMHMANYIKSSVDNNSSPDNENFSIFTDMNMIDNHKVIIKRGSPPGSGTQIYRVVVKDEENNVKLKGEFDNHIDLAFNLRPFVQKSRTRSIANAGQFVGVYSDGFVSKVKNGDIVQIGDNRLLTDISNNWTFKHKNPDTRFVDGKFWDVFTGFANTLNTKFPSGITITNMARSITQNTTLRSSQTSGHALGEGLDFVATDKTQAKILLQAIKQLVPDFEISPDDSKITHYPIPGTNLKIAYHKGTGWHFDVKFQ